MGGRTERILNSDTREVDPKELVKEQEMCLKETESRHIVSQDFYLCAVVGVDILPVKFRISQRS
jgi:hypothetical protein